MGCANNAEKCNMFGNYLRGLAAVIWEGNVENFTFKIAKLYQGANKSTVNFGGR
jgi:hypothetical protein